MSIEQPQPPVKKSNQKIFYLIAIVLLIGGNIFMYVNQQKTKGEKENVEVAKSKVDSAYQQLDRDYQHALAEIEQYKGENASLDSLVHVKEFALQERKNEISKILMKQNLDKEDLARAKELINQLKMENNNIVRQFDSLKIAYKFLANKLDTVQTSLKSKVKENEDLKTTNTVLEEKRRLGSILKITNVKVTGEKEKGKSTKETTNIKKIDFLRLSYDVDANRVADTGEKTVYYRITDPNRQLIYDSNLGSGEITLSEDNTEIKYTGKNVFNYEGKTKSVSGKWMPKGKLLKGEYKVDFYFDGYLISTSSFKLSSGLF